MKKLFILFALILGTLSCNAQQKQYAQIDTMMLKPECIEKIVQSTTVKGAIKHFVVYKDKQQKIEELIPISQSVLTYVQTCKQHGIVPSLAIRLRNGIITNIIRYKPQYHRLK